MNQPEPDTKSCMPPEFQQEVMRPTSPPSQADLLLMAKLFSLGGMGTWVRGADVPTSEPAKRVLRNWVCKGYAYYTQDVDTKTWVIVLEDDCARMCGEALAAAFELRTERSMRDQKIEATEPPFDHVLKWSTLALLVVILIELIVEFFK